MLQFDTKTRGGANDSQVIAIGELGAEHLGDFSSTGAREDLDGRIKTIEQELAELKAQQVELKKEATAAAEALPTFSYRPGNGLLIESADKGWALRAGIETHFRMLHVLLH